LKEGGASSPGQWCKHQYFADVYLTSAEATLFHIVYMASIA